jgi:hypothetical protein
MIALFAAAALAVTTPDALVTYVESYNDMAILPLPPLDAKKAQNLVDGRVIRILFENEDPEKPIAAVAFLFLDVSRNALWIASQDPHTKVDPGLTEAVISRSGIDRAIWYGHWDLPRPIRDRQWVIESWNNHELAVSMDDIGWEHAWALMPDGLPLARPLIERGEVGEVTIAQFEGAIYTPVNRGAWFMFALPDGQTLFGYQASSVVGGAIPSWLVQRLVMSRLESTLRNLETRARQWSPHHYVNDHPPVFGGDGKPVPTWKL